MGKIGGNRGVKGLTLQHNPERKQIFYVGQGQAAGGKSTLKLTLIVRGQLCERLGKSHRLPPFVVC